MMNTPTFAEEAVLAGVMAANERFHDVASLLTADKFTSPLRSRLWSALRDRILAGEPADAVTVAELLPDDSAAIMDLACNTAGGPAYASYAKIVHGNWQRREAAQIAMRLMEGSRSGSDGAVNEAIGSLLALNATATECDYSLKQAMRLAFDQIQAAYENGGQLPGITTGLTDLDAILGGWHDSDLIVCGARPAAGKTALLLNFAEAAAKGDKDGNGRKIAGIISAEQPAQQIGLRTISLGSKVGAADLRRGRVDDLAWAKVTASIRAANDWNVRIYDRSAITLDELVSVARKWKHAHGLDWLGIDYAQRISVPGCDRITEVATVARGLKNLARDLGIPVIALAQVKAAVDQRNDKRPTAGDLANSDELTREADAILMLYREETYFHDLNEQNKPVRKGVAEILIEKNRHGPTGYVETAFIAETMRFGNLDRG
jgi:replicative DNA helicase